MFERGEEVIYIDFNKKVRNVTFIETTSLGVDVMEDGIKIGVASDRIFKKTTIDAMGLACGKTTTRDVPPPKRSFNRRWNT